MKLAHKYTNLDGINIHYVDSGCESVSKDDVSTLVFLHGFPEYWGTWQQQLECFSDDFRVIAPDLPGYNLSDKPTDLHFYSVPNLISFLAEFIATISPSQKVYLIAHDWGGAIAWPLAAFHPQLISKLVILNAAHPSTFTREMLNNPIQAKKSAYIHEFINNDAEDLLSKNNYQYLSEKMLVSVRDDVFTEKAKDKYRQIWSQPGAIKGMLQYYRAMPQLAKNEQSHSDEQKLTNKTPQQNSPLKASSEITIPNIRIDCPTLILWGEQDKAFVNEVLDGIEQYVADCSIIRFPQASHWLHHEQADEVNQAIASFIKPNSDN